jgi:hypothetical protein
MKFEIGLTLTGTVSAGAYTAGVVDFLIDALEEWEKAKTRCRSLYGNDFSKWDTPWHDVLIKGLSGASGGGVTCGLILNSVGKTIQPIRQPTDVTPTIENDFYKTWVSMLGIDQLLATEDFDGKKITSLLNGDAIPDIADQILKPENFKNRIQRPYIDDHLVALMTLTNLTGIPYQLDYQGSQIKSVMYFRHADYAKFELSPNATSQYKDAYRLANDTKQVGFDENFARLKAACLCTCAFPGAFSAQPFSQLTEFLKFRPFENNLFPMTNPVFSFLNADGGILNTEPFKLLHDILMPDESGQNEQGAKDVVRSIIMVAPLIVQETFSEDDQNLSADGLTTVLPEVVNAIRADALFNAEEISLAFNENVYSRFMIAPSRSSGPLATDFVTPAITATILADFGAFISPDFRQHDYFMGRRNTQQFLRRHFALPVKEIADNPVFGPLQITNPPVNGAKPTIKDQFKTYAFTDETTGVDYFPIIPLCGALQQPAWFPAWPAKKGYDLGAIQDKISNRLDKFSAVILSSLEINWLEKIAASFALKKVKNTAAAAAISTISKALTAAKL